MQRQAITDKRGMTHWGCRRCEVGEWLPFPSDRENLCWMCGDPLQPIPIRDMLLNRYPRVGTV